MQAELQWTHVGGYWLDESNQHRYGGQDLLDLSLRQELAGGWIVTARIANLADTAYAERADYSFGNYRYFPGDGREWFVGIEKVF
jgi:outer membrane receptor protein involved in Fe transport